MVGLWEHSLGAAIVSGTISRTLGLSEPEEISTAALLHDIGKVVLDQFMARVQPLFYRILLARGEDSSILEQKIFGIDHNLAGLHLAESWKLPEVIKDVILFHHNPDKAMKNKDLVHLVYVADAIAQKFLPGFEIEHIDTAPFKDSLRFLSLTPDMISDALEVLIDIF